MAFMMFLRVMTLLFTPWCCDYLVGQGFDLPVWPGPRWGPRWRPRRPWGGTSRRPIATRGPPATGPSATLLDQRRLAQRLAPRLGALVGDVCGLIAVNLIEILFILKCSDFLLNSVAKQRYMCKYVDNRQHQKENRMRCGPEKRLHRLIWPTGHAVQDIGRNKVAVLTG